MKQLTLILFSLVLFISCKTEDHNPDYTYKDELIKTGGKAYDRGLFWGTGGDISVRVPNENNFIIKASMYCVGDLDRDKISEVSLEGEHLDGPEPSHETPIHAKLYKMRPEIGAILHMHSPYATAWATAGKKVPVITQQAVSFMKKSGIVPYNPVGSDKLIADVVEQYKDPDINVVYMENHGVFVIGADLEALLYNAEKVENTARIAYLTEALGGSVEFEPDVVY